MTSRPESSFVPPHFEVVSSEHHDAKDLSSAADKLEMKRRLQEELAIVGNDMKVYIHDFNDQILDTFIAAKCSPVEAIIQLERAKHRLKKDEDLSTIVRHLVYPGDFTEDILDIVLAAKCSPVVAIAQLERAKQMLKKDDDIVVVFRRLMAEKQQK